MASLSVIILPESLEVISAGAFRGCTSLRTLTLPEGIEEYRMSNIEKNDRKPVSAMLREKKTSQQNDYEIVRLEELVPPDHLPRKIGRAVDFSFIHALCKALYSPNTDRPAVGPEALFRMLFPGYLYGLPPETKLAQAVNENIVFKWFSGLKLTDKEPDHATISINRVRRFKDNHIAERIFNEILRQCAAKGLVGGEILYTDSTHRKAKANKHRRFVVTISVTPKEYMHELNAQIDPDRKAPGKKLFAHNGNGDAPNDPTGGKTTMCMVSKPDPDSAQRTREDTHFFIEYGSPSCVRLSPWKSAPELIATPRAFEHDDTDSTPGLGLRRHVPGSRIAL